MACVGCEGDPQSSTTPKLPFSSGVPLVVFCTARHGRIYYRHREWQEERNPVMKHGTEVRQTMYTASSDIKTAFDEAKPKHVAQILDSHNTHGWLIAALLREMSGLSGVASFESVASRFSFNRCLRQGSVEAGRLSQKMATQIWVNVEEEWMEKRKGILLHVEREGIHQICSFMWADNIWIVSHSKENLEQMPRDLIEEASKLDLEPKPASLWWTSTYVHGEKSDLIFGYIKGMLQISL